MSGTTTPPDSRHNSDGTVLRAGWTIDAWRLAGQVPKYVATGPGGQRHESPNRRDLENYIRWYGDIEVPVPGAPYNTDAEAALGRIQKTAQAAEDALQQALESKLKVQAYARRSAPRPTRERLWLAMGAAAGLLVGGLGVGLVAANQAPEAPVTPPACVAALDYADTLIGQYGDALTGITAGDYPAIRDSNEKVKQVSPRYTLERGDCLARVTP